MKLVPENGLNPTALEKELNGQVETQFAQLDAPTSQREVPNETELDPEITPFNVIPEDFVPARDGGVDGRGAFGGNRLLSVIKRALADDLDLPQALGNERNIFQSTADTIEANRFTPFYEGSATGFSTGNFLSSVSNFGLTGPFSSIAFAPPHLAPLLDESIERLIQFDPFDDLQPIDRSNNVETIRLDAEITETYAWPEDNVLIASLFAEDVTDFNPTIITEPLNGTIVFKADGSFSFTPDTDYSGIQTVVIQFIDPNNGSVRIETITIDVTPVLDAPVLLDGATTVNEDNTIPLGQDIDITIDDATDGSQTLEITLAGIPAGVVVTATTFGDVTLVQQPDGSYVLSGGTPADVLAVLDTLVLDAPEHNADDFVVTVSATATEEDGTTETVTAEHSVTIVDVADQPTVVGGAFETDEDVPVLLEGLDGGLVDGDGSEVLSFTLSDVPAGANFNGAGTFDATTGLWTFTAAEIEAGLTFVPPPEEDGTFVFTITAIATESENGDQASVSAPVTVVIAPVVDPVIALNAQSSGPEDEPIALGSDIDFTLDDPTGEQSLEVELDGIPPLATIDFTAVPGVSVVDNRATGGTLVISGANSNDVQALLETLTVTPELHNADDFNVDVTLTTTEAGEPPQSVSVTQTVVVTPVVDAPTVSPDVTFNTDEDTAVTLTGLGGALVDQDGSETLSFELTNVPEGASFGGAGTLDPDTGVWTFTPAEIAAGITFEPPEHLDGTFEFEFIAVSTETETGEQARTASTVTIVVEAEADAPVVSGSSSINEDSTLPLGDDINIALVDQDGSETLGVTISGFPFADVDQINFTNVGGAVATYDPATGTLTISGGTAQDVLDTLATVTGTPTEHDDQDFDLTISATTTDSDGSTATTNHTHPVTVTAVADGVTIAGSSTGLEDTPIVVGANIGLTVIDADGTEHITGVTIGSIPTGPNAPESVTLDGSEPATVSFNYDAATGEVTITSSNSDLAAADAEIRAALATLTITPNEDSDEDFTLDVAVDVLDNDGSTTTSNGTHEVTVTAVVDGVTITGSSTGTEDTPITIGADIGIAEIDADGSEHVTGVTITDIPTGPNAPESVTLDGSEPATVSFSYDAATGEVTITSSNPDLAAADAEIRAALATLTITPNEHSDDDFTLNVAVDVTDNDGSTTTNNASHAVTVTAVADAPTANADVAITTNEDADIAIPGIGAAASLDADGSETLTFVVSGVPAGASFATGTDNGDGTFTFTAAELAADPVFTPPAGFSGQIDLTLTARSTEARDNGDGLNFEEDSHDITIIVNPVVDPATFGGSGSEIVNEDTEINIGQNIDIMIDDATDGSTDADITFSGIPADATINFDAFAGINVIDTRATDGNITFDIPSGSSALVQDLLDLIDTFTVTPAEDADANFTVGVEVTINEIGSGLAPETTTFDHAVTVQAVADAPTVSGSGGDVEDATTPISVPITVGLTDTDGSEEITEVVIGDIPDAATFAFTDPLPAGVTIGTVTAAGIETVTVTIDPDVFTGGVAGLNDFLATATIIPPASSGDDINLSVAATSTETTPTEPGDVSGGIAVPTATTTSTVVVDIVPVADVPNVVAPDDRVIDEDATITLTGQSGSLNDNDGSETLTYQITANSLPAGVNLADLNFTTASGDPIPFANGAFQLTATQLAGLQFAPAENADGVFDLRITATATDAATDDPETTATAFDDFVITVAPVVDAPLVSGSTTVNEDVGGTGVVNFGTNINVRLDDDDGSEAISSVTLSNFAGPAGTISFDASDPNITIDTSTPGSFVITSSRTGADGEADIQAAIDSFELTLETHNDANITFDVTAVSTQLSDNTTASAGPTSHLIRVRAVADAPTATANDVSGLEDTPIALNLSAVDSADSDGSETLSARISGFPDGSSITSTLGTLPGNGNISSANNVFTVTADTTADLNVILASLQVNLTENFPTPSASSFTGTLEVISTEAATGIEVAVAQAVDTTTFTVDVEAVVDGAALSVTDATGENVGFEDTPIRLLINPQLADDDGSEVITSLEITGVPAGASIIDSNGVAIGTPVDNGDGTFTYTFSEAEAAIIFGQVPPAIFVLPPLNSNEDFTLGVSVTVAEDLPGNAGDGDSVTAGPVPLNVVVTGVADPIIAPTLEVTGVEDQPITLGAQISASLSGLLVDTDGSETTSLVVSGLPAGFIPAVGTLIGPGVYSIPFADLAGFTLPSDPDFSGDYLTDVLPGLELSIVVQEDDGNQAVTVLDDISINVLPVVDGANLNRAIDVTEDTSISLANADNITLRDNDGSEELINITFDLNSLIADAGIQGRLNELEVGNAGNSDIDFFIDTYINGTFTNNGDGTITVLAADVDGVSFATEPFLDSNRDFSIPITGSFEDTDGTNIVTGTSSGTFSINLIGDADVPTAVAEDASGVARTPIALNLSGEITDRDTELGEARSESIDYIISVDDNPGNLLFTFTDAAGNLIGTPLSPTVYSISEAELPNLHLLANGGAVDSDLSFTLTSISRENDGDLETFSAPASFVVTVAPDPDGLMGDGDPPAAPSLGLNSALSGTEDAGINLDLSVTTEPGTQTGVVFSNIPAGVIVTGALFDPGTGNYFASADDVNNGLVSFSVDPDGPLEHSDTDIEITVEAISTNANLQSTSSGESAFIIPVTAVADEANISIGNTSGDEDTELALGLSIGLEDNDGSETIDGNVTIVVPDTVTLNNAGAGVTSGGFTTYTVPAASLGAVTLDPSSNADGSFDLTVRATTIEASNGDSLETVETFSISIEAEADDPIATANDSFGDEDTPIALTGLSAALSDTDGSEILSVTISGLPDDTLLSAGTNNGDGSFTINAADLATLTLTPPRNFAGVLALSLNAFALDADGSLAEVNVPFDVTVNAIVDSIGITPVPVSGDEDTAVTLNLDIRQEDENEQVELVFTNVTDGVIISTGGSLVDNGGGQFTFLGTAAEAATLSFDPAENFSGDVSFDVDATSVETDAAVQRSATVSSTVDVTIDAVVDTVTLDPADAQVLAGGVVDVDFGAELEDADETVELVITGVANGALTAGSGTLTDDGGGQFTFTGTQEEADTLQFDPVDTFDGDVILSIAATPIDDGNRGTTVNDTITISVEASSSDLTGDANANVLTGDAADNAITGGQGADVLTGGGGADTFVYELADNDGNVDTITDFSVGDNDALDLSALIDPQGDPIEDFLSLTDNGTDTTVSIDADGTGGGAAVDLVVLEGVSGSDLTTLVNNGNIVV
ncbi:MAG: type I secretion C-terminal target domain-containing protein [Hyphomicrobiales bacterium]